MPRFFVFDDDDNEYKAQVLDIGEKASIQIIEKCLGKNELPALVTCAFCIPKGKRLDFMIQKLVELGIHQFIPLRCQRSVVRLHKSKFDRLKRIAIEASKQCGRAKVIDILEEIDFESLCQVINKFDYTYIATLNTEQSLLAKIFSLDKLPKQILYIIGPEDGFTDSEEAIAIKNGAIPVRLSKTILRIETAAIVTMAIISQGIEITTQKHQT